MPMENSHSETRLILSLSLQDIDNFAKDLKPKQRMFRFFSLLRHAISPYIPTPP